MDIQQPDNLADILPDTDRHERVARLEPLKLPMENTERPALQELALELATRSTSLSAGLPDSIVASIADLVRIMNCYYSNLIEGHDTHPYDIERAQKKDYSDEPQMRNLQLEAEAHIAVQQWIDGGGLDGRITNVDGIIEVHRRFCERLPQELLVSRDPDTGEEIGVVGGQFRTRDVKVGNLVAISPGAISRFMARFAESYAELGRAETIIATPAAHHRLLWIHPFMDGNGRVARLISYAQLREATTSGGIWSIARGLARNVSEYKQRLANCDHERWNDVDGRGHLSERALVEFTQFFLTVAIDQVNFMNGLIQPSALHRSILGWAESERKLGKLPSGASTILEAVLYRGQLPRGDVPSLLGVVDRQGRRVVASLVEKGVITSASDRAPLRLALPAKLAGRWLPGLFPEA